VSYSSAEASELPASTTILDSHTTLFGLMGYGGIDLHRRIFGSHRHYLLLVIPYWL